MRINLDGKFKDIKPLVDASNKRDVKAPTEYAFDKILASISPRKEELLKKIGNITSALEIQNNTKSKNNEVMASIKFDVPQLHPPDPVPVQIVNDELKDEVSVKTPALLDVRRKKKDAITYLNKPEKIAEAGELARKFGLEQGIDPALSMSIISNESGFNPRAISQDGHFSKGLMQLLDSTGSQYHSQTDIDGKYDPFNPEQNVKLGISYLRYLHNIFSKPTELPNELVTYAAANSSSLEKLAVAAYNAGEGRVASAQARAKQQGNDPASYDLVASYLPETTRKYVEKVMHSKLHFGNEIQDDNDEF